MSRRPTVAEDRPVRLDELVQAPPAWMTDALCTEDAYAHLDPFDAADAREFEQICTRCLVCPDCGAYADGLVIRAGVWGGKFRGGKRRPESAAPSQGPSIMDP